MTTENLISVLRRAEVGLVTGYKMMPYSDEVPEDMRDLLRSETDVVTRALHDVRVVLSTYDKAVLEA